MKNNKKLLLLIKDLFKVKEKLHKDLAKLPLEKKIWMLFRLQEIAKNFKSA